MPVYFFNMYKIKMASYELMRFMRHWIYLTQSTGIYDDHFSESAFFLGLSLCSVNQHCCYRTFKKKYIYRCPFNLPLANANPKALTVNVWHFV
jgi:hypothetical protein